MLQFSSNETVSLEKRIDSSVPVSNTKLENIDYEYELPKCTEWIKSNGFKHVCLQFPDFLLPDSTEVATRLQTSLGQIVYVLGDTAYESCCVDYVSAAHVSADAIIHYGPTCFSKTSDNILCLYIYEKKALDVHHFRELFNKRYTCNEDIVIVLDTPYIIHLENVKNAFRDSCNIRVCPVNQETLLLDQFETIFVSQNRRKVENLKLTLKPKILYVYDPESNPTVLINYEQDLKVLKRRYFLIEKIKDSNTIGIIIGTLAVKNYLKVIDRTKRLIHHSSKKYYVISVGKPTVAKLANFPEVDVYVVVSCAMNEIYDSRDFYKPIVTPYDVELALNPCSQDLQFSYDYNSYLPETNLDLDALKQTNETKNDVSLITGKVRITQNTNENENDEKPTRESQIALRNQGTIAVNTNFGAGFLSERSWKGLEQNLGEDEPEIATEGRKGIAQGYENETKS